ncbi:MAG TPA: AmmeMemoRadiSam system protein A [Thermoanaerobaculia bacterium]|jgi:AmmeMemoRadiSam system protein A|nr:AmmeMemoRadiSam system protein A [Thermoanaerobaculia bacterium]
MFELNEEQRKTLLRIARQSIAAVLEGGSPDWKGDDFDETLRQPAGAFVTLTRDGDLRGCIGSIRAVEPLYKAVVSSAISAAFRDPRFPPLVPGELEQLELEISVMGPIERVANVEDIVVGRDGLIISRGAYAGLLLPQVATEYSWDRQTFLEQTCRKAGLPPDAWRSQDCRIEKFSAFVFGE